MVATESNRLPSFKNRRTSSPLENEPRKRKSHPEKNLSSDREPSANSGLDIETKKFSATGRGRTFFVDIPFYRTTYSNFIENAKRLGLAAQKQYYRYALLLLTSIWCSCQYPPRDSKFFGPSFDYKDCREILKMRKSLWIILTVLLVAVTAPKAHADSFNISGTVTITKTTITWTNNSSPFSPDKTQIAVGPTGIYSALGGTTASIDDLNFATEPIGTAFTAQPFLSFDADPALSPLLINFIFAGIYSPAGCTATPPAAGQTCTPSSLGSPSPFNFANNPSGSGIFSTDSWSVQGVSANGLETWSGLFTSQFPESFQAVLAALLAPGGPGSVTSSYSATIDVSGTTTTPMPEPSSLLLLGSGFIALVGARAKLRIH